MNDPKKYEIEKLESIKRKLQNTDNDNEIEDHLENARITIMKSGLELSPNDEDILKDLTSPGSYPRHFLRNAIASIVHFIERLKM